MIEEYTVSSLINILEKVKEKDGDIPVRLLNSQYGLTMYLTNVGTVYEKPNGRVDYEDSGESGENTKVFCIVYC